MTAAGNPDFSVSRLVAQCPHRSRVRLQEGVETARCGFLAEAAGIDDDSLLAVRRDACECCVRSPQSIPGRINSVHASLLFNLAHRVLERGGVPGCDAGKAGGIRDWAEENLRFDDGLEPVNYDALDRVGVASRCIHFGERLGAASRDLPGGPQEPPLHRCRHPDRGTTTVEECRTCRHWTDRPLAPSPSLEEIFVRRGPRAGPRVARWAVGVTTAPRLRPTLGYCLDSLIRAGWTEPRIFADSAVELSERHARLPLSVRDPKLGAWPNYYLSLVELLMRDPRADAYMLVQDDAIFHDRENLRQFLEQEVLWPDPDAAFVSLYCSRSYTRPAPGWYELDRMWVWGAIAMVFPRESAKRLALDREVLEHRWSERNDGCANIDVVIGGWAKRNGLKVFFPTPSLVQHIGDASTLWPAARAVGSRRADRFSGDR